MRFLVLVIVLAVSAPLLAAQQDTRSNPGEPCGDDTKGLPAGYYEEVLSRIAWNLPDEHGALIKIAVGSEVKLILWTDGEKYELWTDVPDIPQGTIGAFLMNLLETCELPPDPWDAASMIKVTWEHKDLSAAEFAQMHRGFTEALSKYVAKMQDRYGNLISTQLMVIHVDSVWHRIVYDNGGYEHIETYVWDEDDEDVFAAA